MKERERRTAGALRAQRMDERMDLERLPVRRVETGHRIKGGIIVALGLGWFWFATGLGRGGEWVAWLSPIPWAGALVAAFGAHAAVWRREVELDGQGVVVRTRGIFGRKEWREELGAYGSAALRSELRYGEHRNLRVYLVELRHRTEARKNAAVFFSMKQEGWRESWREAAGRLGLEALDETAGK